MPRSKTPLVPVDIFRDRIAQMSPEDQKRVAIAAGFIKPQQHNRSIYTAEVKDLKKTVGLTPDPTRKDKGCRTHMRESTALRLCKALDIYPAEVGF